MDLGLLPRAPFRRLSLACILAILAMGSRAADSGFSPSDWGPFRPVLSQGSEDLIIFQGRIHGNHAYSENGVYWQQRPTAIRLLSKANGELWGYLQPDLLTPGHLAHSQDGIRWVVVPGATDLPTSRVVHGAGTFVYTTYESTRFSGSSYAAWSTNGSDWLRVHLPGGITDGPFRHLAFGNGIFLAVNAALGRTFTSTNGRNWSEGALPQVPGALVPEASSDVGS